MKDKSGLATQRGCEYERTNSEEDDVIIDCLKNPWNSIVKEQSNVPEPYKAGGVVKKKGGKVCKNTGGSLDIIIKKPGALHKEMGIPEDKKIPTKALNKEKAKAKATGDKKLMKQVTFAKNAKKWKK